MSSFGQKIGPKQVWTCGTTWTTPLTLAKVRTKGDLGQKNHVFLVCLNEREREKERKREREEPRASFHNPWSSIGWN